MQEDVKKLMMLCEDQRSKIKELLEVIEGTCQHVRERYEQDDVCGLCEYDGAYIGQSGDWINECPGFDTNECFKLSESFKAKYL